MFQKFLSVLALLSVVSACAPGGVVQSGTRLDLVRDYRLAELNFAAMAGVTISEENNLYPQADIVWHGDVPGDRIAQIGALFHAAAARNMAGTINGIKPVTVEITLVRFHGLTRRARFSTGGVYHIVFDMTLRDYRSGAVIEPARRIVTNLEAWGGNANARRDAQGVTEKARVADFLTSVLADQLR